MVTQFPGTSTLLIVDDNIELLNMLSLALKTLGHFTILRATDGASGLEQAITVHPDSIIVDIMMPELSGYQFVRALRGDPATADIPIIILSALAQDKDRFIGLATGADQYLTKPTTPQTLVAAIRQAMTLTRQERERRLRALAQDTSGLEPLEEPSQKEGAS